MKSGQRGDIMLRIRTDLALESRELYQENNKREVPGVIVDREDFKDATVTRIDITGDQGAQAMGKAKGKYITIECPALRNANADLKDEISKLLAKELKRLLPMNKNIKVLVVGLGNWNITADALGPKVVSKVFVTRHLFKMYNKESDESLAELSAISPGVMGITGVETSEIIRGVVEKTQPNLVVVVDALASRRMERVNATIQLSTTGISPGSGVGNNRKALDETTLGVPVIAIGVPTVVDAATLTNDVIEMIIDSFMKESQIGSQFYEMLKNLKNEEKYALIKEVMEPYNANLIVTPKEVDEVIHNLSQIIANGVNIALHPGIDLQDVNRYIH